MNHIERLQKLAGIALTEGKEFSSDKNYSDKNESELLACKKELKAIQAITSKASFKWKDAQTEIEKVDAALDALKNKEKEDKVDESIEAVNEAAFNVFLNGKKIDTVFYNSDMDTDEVKKSLIDHDGYDSGITVKKEKAAKKDKLKEAKFDTIELRLPASWASALVNGDTTGMDDEEEAEMDRWIEWASGKYNINAGQPVDVSGEPEFAHQHDASPDVLATDVLTYTYFVNEAVNEDYESPEKLYVLKIAEPGSDKFGIQFSGTRQECIDEWKDTKESWGKGAKHKIERHIEESAERDNPMDRFMASSHKNLSIEQLEKNIDAIKDQLRRIPRGSTSFADLVAQLRKYEDELVERKLFNESAETIAAKIIQEVDGTKTPEVDYQNGPTENSGIKAVQKKTIRIPSDVRAEANKRIRELNKAIGEYDEKGYNDKSIKAQAAECLEKIMDNLKAGDEEGVKQAQIYFGTLMSPLTDLFPPKFINWLANANNKLMKENMEDDEFDEEDPLDDDWDNPYGNDPRHQELDRWRNELAADARSEYGTKNGDAGVEAGEYERVKGNISGLSDYDSTHAYISLTTDRHKYELNAAVPYEDIIPGETLTIDVDLSDDDMYYMRKNARVTIPAKEAEWLHKKIQQLRHGKPSPD